MTVDINKILAKPVYKACSKYGASMGRKNVIAIPVDGTLPKLHLQKLRLVSWDYDTGGAYWGCGGKPLWCAFADAIDITPIMVFVRGANREDAKNMVLALLPKGDWKFYK
jgi:hypothetical protein